MRAGPKFVCSYARTMLFLASLVVVASFVEPPRPPGGLEIRPAIVVDDPHDALKAPVEPDPVPPSPQGVGSGGSGWLLVLPPVLLAVVLVLLGAWYMRGGPTEEERRAALRRVRERQALDAHQASHGDTDQDTDTEHAALWHEQIPPQAPCPSAASAWSVCVPLTSVEELYAWAPPCLTETHCLPHHPATVAYRAPPANVLHEQTRRGRLLVCHDFKGGYHPYETPSYPSLRPFHTEDSNQANYRDGAYRLSQWAMVDGFIYFAHSLVSLPPPQWVSAAHLSGAKAIGTFITEWGEGHDKCHTLFQDNHSAERAALQLARMAVYHRLEGWLINIENKIDWPGGVEAIVHFLSTLTSQLRALVGHASVVLWYDSVTADTGELQWQNGLTSRNEAFFSACDGLFVNYVWDLDKLAASAARAMTQSRAGRRWDVYMGIDCFGRNTYGGGGWQCKTALEAIRHAGLSAALFAPGWVWENEVAPHIKTQDNTQDQQEEEEEAKEGEADQHPEGEEPKAVECYVEWGQVEAAFQCKQRDFWASLAQVWPAKPWPPSVSFCRPLLTNFSSGAGTRLYGPQGPYSLSPTHDPHNTTTPWCSVGLQDVLPLPLTLCPPSPSTVDLRLCPTHAYRGSSSLLLSACLPGPTARLSTMPLFSLWPQPTLMQALEVHIAYKLPHNHSLTSEEQGDEDDLYVEVVLQGAPSSQASATTTTVLVLRGHTKDQDPATSTQKGNLRGSGSEGWESRRVGSAKDGDTQLLFYGPTAHYTDPLPNPSAPPSPLPTAAHTLQVLEGAVQSAVQGGSSYQEAACRLKGCTDSLYEAQDRLDSIPWTHRVWRLRDLALVGRTLHHVRLCCVKKKRPCGAAPCPYFRGYVGELMLAHVPKAWASPINTPVTSLLPSLTCTHLSLTPMQGPGLQGLLQWTWAQLDMPLPAPEDGTLQAQDAVRQVDVLLLVPNKNKTEGEAERPVWLGRSLTCSFMVDTAHWPLTDIGSEGTEAGTVELRLAIQPTDLWGNTLPLASCPTLVLTTPTPTPTLTADT